MTRPCRWPDGGCGAEILDALTINGKKQVLDPVPVKAIVMVRGDDHDSLSPQVVTLFGAVARVVDTYVDHHATCPAWAAKLERERAAKAARP